MEESQTFKKGDECVKSKHTERQAAWVVFCQFLHFILCLTHPVCIIYTSLPTYVW